MVWITSSTQINLLRYHWYRQRKTTWMMQGNAYQWTNLLKSIKISPTKEPKLIAASFNIRRMAYLFALSRCNARYLPLSLFWALTQVWPKGPSDCCSQQHRNSVPAIWGAMVTEQLHWKVLSAVKAPSSCTTKVVRFKGNISLRKILMTTRQLSHNNAGYSTTK